jgi:hypothetical protein
MGGQPAEFAELVARDIVKWRVAAEAAGLKK